MRVVVQFGDNVKQTKDIKDVLEACWLNQTPGSQLLARNEWVKRFLPRQLQTNTCYNLTFQGHKRGSAWTPQQADNGILHLDI